MALRSDQGRDSAHRLHGQPNHDAARRAPPRYRASDDHGVASAEARFALAGEAEAAPRAGSGARRRQAGRQSRGAVQSAARAAARCRCNCRRPTRSRSRAGHAGPDRPSLGGPQGAHDTRRARPGWADRIEPALRIHAARAELHQAARQGRGRAAQEARARARLRRAGSPGRSMRSTIGGEKAIADSPSILRSATPIGGSSNDPLAEVDRERGRVSSGSSRSRSRTATCPRPSATMKTAQENLSEALKKDASPEEIERLVDELREALRRYLQALAEQASRRAICRRADEPERRSGGLRRRTSTSCSTISRSSPSPARRTWPSRC